jgi:hypothetical protein
VIRAFAGADGEEFFSFPACGAWAIDSTCSRPAISPARDDVNTLEAGSAIPPYSMVM